MNLRRHLRVWAAVSLIAQSAWLFALVPRDCCAAHMSATAACHDEVTPVPHCPMEDSTGAACPMHRAGETHPVADDCRMRADCNGPMSALLTLLSVQAVLPDAAAGLAAAAPTSHTVVLREQPLARFVPPDLPPPRV